MAFGWNASARHGSVLSPSMDEWPLTTCHGQHADRRSACIPSNLPASPRKLGSAECARMDVWGGPSMAAQATLSQYHTEMLVDALWGRSRPGVRLKSGAPRNIPVLAGGSRAERSQRVRSAKKSPSLPLCPPGPPSHTGTRIQSPDPSVPVYLRLLRGKTPITQVRCWRCTTSSGTVLHWRVWRESCACGVCR